MSRDYGEMEQEFLASLEADTGRDLAGWMAELDTRTFDHRNDMIDWLRQQGFMFSWASWLERIHHNGGRPIYGDRPPAKARPEAAIAAPGVPEPPAPKGSTASRVTAAAVVPPAPSDLPAFLAKAKGYRPLADLVIRHIRTAAPAAGITVHESFAMFSAPSPFAALAVTAKDVRLSLDLGDCAFEGDIKRLRLHGTPANLTHTIVLTDARRVDQELLALVSMAAGRANT